MHEIELKFQVPPARRSALWSAFKRGRTVQTTLKARYFDTKDGLLAQQGIAIRLRLEGDAHWVQTLKTRGEHGVVRLEHNAEVEGTADATPPLDLQRHAGSPAHEQLMRALQQTSAGPVDTALVEVYRTDVVRHTRLFKAGEASVEAAFDTGRVMAGDAAHELCELEFELKSGRLPALFATAAPWVQRHGLWFDTVSKAQRGYLLARGRAYGKAIHAEPPVVDAGMRTGPLVRAVVSACLQQVLPNSSAVAAGSPQDEHIHQLRVGLRRLRTALGELQALDAAIDPAWEAPLATAFRGLGLLRDQQLLATQTAEALKAAGAPEMPAPPLGAAVADAAALVQAPAFQQSLLAVLAFALDDAGDPGPAEPLELLRQRLDHLHRQIARKAKRFRTLPAERQHQLRKRLKRLRYLAEFIAPLFRKSKVAAYFKALRPAQDALGTHNDEAVALEEYRRQAKQDAHAWFAVGWLTARQPASAEAAAKALKKAVAAPPFWRNKPKASKGSR